jgi:hypothetical protein
MLRDPTTARFAAMVTVSLEWWDMYPSQTCWLFFAIILLHANIGLAQSKEQCALAGTVVNSVTNAGIPHALIAYNGSDSGYRFTDAGGNFRVDGVPCSNYSVSATKQGFEPEADDSQVALFLAATEGMDGLQELGSDSTQADRRPKAAQTMLDVKPDSQPARIVLLPLTVITGTVIDENGEPLAGVSIQAISVKPKLSGVDYVAARAARTDDRGGFSLLNLSPADYLVRLAGEVSSTRYYQGTLNTSNDHRGMQPVYYPNGDSVSSAQVFHLSPGERGNADFRQPTEPAFDIYGHLTGFLPNAWTQLQAYREGDRLPVGVSYVNSSNGQFRFIDFPPGTYTLRAVQYQTDPPQWLAAEEALTVKSEPVRDVVMELNRGAEIPVTVVYEAGAKEQGPIQLMLMPQHTRSNVRHLSVGKAVSRPELDRAEQAKEPAASGASAPQKQAFTDVLPDRYRLNVIGNMNGYIASATFGEQEVLHSEFQVNGAAGEMHITVRGDGAVVEGKVQYQGQPAQGVQVYLIPAGGGARLKLGMTDQEGHYQIADVPPGDFRIQAWVGSPNPKDLLSASGNTITLGTAEKRTVDLEAAQGKDMTGQFGRVQ